MRILVTGGGGFLGGAICRQLLARGDEVIAYQRSRAEELGKLGAQVTQGDITDYESLKAASRGTDAIIHTAAKAGLSVRYEDFFAPNVTGTQNVLDACRSNAVSKLVFTSSPSVTHADGDIEGGNESLPYPETYSSPYPETKARSEQMVMAADCADLHTVSLRPHLIWGPGDNHLLPKLMERARHGKLKLPGPDKLIDATYIDNAARAHLLALDKLASQPEVVGGKTYFISNDEPVTQAGIIGGLLKAAGLEVEIQAVSPRLAYAAGALLETGWKLFGLRSDPPLTRWSAEHLSTAHWYDISAAKRDLGYSIEVSISEGLEILAQTYHKS